MAKAKHRPRAIKPTKPASQSKTPLPRRQYKKNFLQQVIARVDFASQLPEGEKSPLENLRKVLRKNFPIMEVKKQVFSQVAFSTAEGMQQSQIEKMEWIFHAKDKSKNAYLGMNHFYVQYKTYESFEVLQQEFHAGLNAILDSVPDLQVKRLGLRYIDNIEFPKEPNPTSWSEYLCEALLSSFSLADDQSTISRAFHVLEFNYGDMRMRFQYGMPNPDFPAAIKKKMFALDYDAYCEQLIERDNIPNYFVRFHDKISKAFEQVITDGLRKKMGVVNERK